MRGLISTFFLAQLPGFWEECKNVQFYHGSNHKPTVDRLLGHRQLSQMGSSNPYCGGMATVLDVASERLNFTYEMQTVLSYGIPLPNGTWIGLVGMIARSELDLGISFMTLTWDRVQVVDFIEHFAFTNLAMILPLPNQNGAQKHGNPLNMFGFDLIEIGALIMVCVSMFALMLASWWTKKDKDTSLSLLEIFLMIEQAISLSFKALLGQGKA